MSKFVDKLQRLSRFSIPSIGFHQPAAESKSSVMLLVAGLSGKDVKEAEAVGDSNVDAGLILNQGLNNRSVKQMVKAMSDIPLGVFLKDLGKESVGKLADLGCDFVVFDMKMPMVALQREELGQFLMIEPSSDQGLVRAINGLDVDGVFINGGEKPFITVEHLLVCQRFSELLDKPVVAILPSPITGAELDNLSEAGIDAIVVPPEQPPEVFMGLRGMIDNLPKGAKRRQRRAGAVLPHYTGGAIDEEEEEEEEI